MKIVAVDLQAMAPIPGVIQLQGDITTGTCTVSYLLYTVNIVCKWQVSLNTTFCSICPIGVDSAADHRTLRGGPGGPRGL